MQGEPLAASNRDAMTTAQTTRLDDHVRGLLRAWLIAPGLTEDHYRDIAALMAARWWVDRVPCPERQLWQRAWADNALDTLATLRGNDADLCTLTRLTVALYGAEA